MSEINASDVVEFSTINDSLSDGKSLTRTFIVSNVTGTATSKPINAITTAGIPTNGDVHPDQADIVVTSRSCKPVNNSSTQWQIDCIYSIPDAGEDKVDSGGVFQIGGGLAGTQANKDKDGAIMYLGTLDADAAPTPSDNPTEIPKIPALVDKQIPVFTLRIERQNSTNPQADAKTYVGTVNKDNLTLDGESYAARTLLCNRIDGTTNDGGSTWSTTYEFQYNPDTWDVIAVAINPQTSAPYSNIENIKSGISDGKTVGGDDNPDPFRIYKETDFTLLSLSN